MIRRSEMIFFFLQDVKIQTKMIGKLLAGGVEKLEEGIRNTQQTMNRLQTFEPFKRNHFYFNRFLINNGNCRCATLFFIRGKNLKKLFSHSNIQRHPRWIFNLGYLGSSCWVPFRPKFCGSDSSVFFLYNFIV